LRYSTKNDVFIGTHRALRQRGNIDHFEVGMKDLFLDGIQNGRDGRGSIYVWPSGNGHLQVYLLSEFFFPFF
jgi:hypothetical protein